MYICYSIILWKTIIITSTLIVTMILLLIITIRRQKIWYIKPYGPTAG